MNKFSFTLLSMVAFCASNCVMETNLKTVLADRGFSLSKLAGAVGVDKSVVTRWCQKRVPAERVKAVADVTGITPHELRPDIFPASEPAQ
jgi:DNA-binding transcriptional regulator YdaS (Cro superfamily)